ESQALSCLWGVPDERQLQLAVAQVHLAVAGQPAVVAALRAGPPGIRRERGAEQGHVTGDREFAGSAGAGSSALLPCHQEAAVGSADGVVGVVPALPAIGHRLVVYILHHDWVIIAGDGPEQVERSGDR